MEVEKVVIVSKNGVRTIMPSIQFAKDRVKGIWKGKVDRIEVTSVIKVENKE